MLKQLYYWVTNPVVNVSYGNNVFQVKVGWMSYRQWRRWLKRMGGKPL